jgi:hypothetical protein
VQAEAEAKAKAKREEEEAEAAAEAAEAEAEAAAQGGPVVESWDGKRIAEEIKSNQRGKFSLC